MKYKEQTKFIESLIHHQNDTSGNKMEELLKILNEKDFIELAQNPETSRLIEKWKKLEKSNSTSTTSAKRYLEQNHGLSIQNQSSKTHDDDTIRKTLTTDTSMEKISFKSKTPAPKTTQSRKKLKNIVQTPLKPNQKLGDSSPKSPKRGLLNNYFSRTRSTPPEKPNFFKLRVSDVSGGTKSS